MEPCVGPLGPLNGSHATNVIPVSTTDVITDLYRATATPRIVEVPEMIFVMIDGHGDPNISSSYQGLTIAKLHALIEEQGLTFDGQLQKHHEIYLGDPRRAVSERLRTIVRQPVA